MTSNTQPPVGLSVWEHDLYEHLTDHMQNELALVDRYAALAESAGGHVSYLLKLIMEDEARHHRLFDEWRNALQSNAEFREVEPQVPHLSRSKEAEVVREAAREFLEVERADERDLHRLQKSLKTVKDTTIWSLLVDMMECDTKKHQLILEFLEKHPGE
jgi:rubrerythrin